jgi:hypothetical protein
MGGPDGHEVAVVWSLEQSLVPDWLESDEELYHACSPSARMRSGQLELVAERATWPLQQAVADRWCGPLDRNSQQAGCWRATPPTKRHPLAGQGTWAWAMCRLWHASFRSATTGAAPPTEAAAPVRA